MRNLIPEIPAQIALYKQLYQIMQGDIIGEIMRQSRDSDTDRFLHGDLKGHSLQVLPNILPALSALCEDVKAKLEFDEPIDFYITGSSEVNACAILSHEEGKPHIIDINSALFNLMSEDELRYIIGHEIGHLINRDGALKDLFYFIYPAPDAEDANVPHFFRSRFELWGRLAEFSADRYGYLACKNIEACVTAIFKLSSHLSLDKMNIQINDLLEVNNRSLEYLLKENLCVGGSHPIHPARIEALRLFATAKTKIALEKGMDNVMELVEGYYYPEINEVIATFFASAGLFMCKDRGKAAKAEEDFIINRMADYVFLPVKQFKVIAKQDYVVEMQNSLKKALELDPNCIVQLVGFLIDLAFVDNRIEPEELNKIFTVANELGIDPAVLFKALTDKIRSDFQPQAALMN